MKRLFNRLLSGLAFAVPLALVAFAITRTSPVQTALAAEGYVCQDCHASFQTTWEQGAHGQATKSETFQADWTAQGKPKECLSCHTTGFDSLTGTYAAEGVTCAACHNPIGEQHPLSPAYMSRAADACGECHRETHFEWRSSQHGTSDLTCVSCHDPHATSLKAADTSTLCASCHGVRVAAYGHSEHANQGLTCTDCHISATKDTIGMGQGSHNHSFSVNLTKCTDCHAQEIHNPSKAMLVNVPASTPQPPDSMSSGHPQTVTHEPEPVSPLGYAVFAGLIGLALGIVLAPWLERGFHFVQKRQKSEVKL